MLGFHWEPSSSRTGPREKKASDRGRRPIFNATLRAGASWLFFRVARSTRMTQIWALRSRLEKQPTDLRQNTSYFGDRTLGPNLSGTRTAFMKFDPIFVIRFFT